MTWHTLRYDAIEAFRQSWPCHGLPDDLHSISAEFDENGDLVAVEAYADEQRLLDTHDFDGPALLALVNVCRQSGDESD